LHSKEIINLLALHLSTTVTSFSGRTT